ncbi:hypothetical protein CRUP_020442 [Coryphaenoides rupestris]|nr:hypothetical protein CRUP_020442 [Coryphaenoides rupestris]
MKMTAPSQTASALPLEELLALYGYGVPGQILQQPARDRCQLAAGLPPPITLDKDQMTKDMFAGDEEEDPSATDELTPSYTSNTSELLRRLQERTTHCLSGGDEHTAISSSEEDSDSASIPSNEEHKDIMVGSMYQAKIPPLSPYTLQGRAYEGDDQLLWTPAVLPVQDVEGFLRGAQTPGGQEVAPYTYAHGDSVVRDNEQEERRSFEQGYRAYGKNFHLIQANKVRTRSVGECVQYYYMWKKSERHEDFTLQGNKLGRRKFPLQPENIVRIKDNERPTNSQRMTRLGAQMSQMTRTSGQQIKREDEDQDGDLGQLESHGNTKAPSHNTLRAQRTDPAPHAPSSGQHLDKPVLSLATDSRRGHAGGESRGLSVPDSRPQQLFGYPLCPPRCSSSSSSSSSSIHRGSPPGC